MSLTSVHCLWYDYSMKTTQITVRNVDSELKKRIDKIAKLKAMSLNDFVLDTLRSKVGGTTADKTITWHRYSGVMDRAAINQEVLEDFETIDPAMWKHDRG